MKKIISALAVALCIVLPSRADNTDAHIYGHVIDKATGEHLPYTAVLIKGTTLGVTTENSGHYIIRNVPEGTFIIEVSTIGYKTQKREITIKKGISYEVNFILEEDHVQLDGVIVPAIAEDPNRAEPPPRMTSTLSTMLAGSCSMP